MLLQNRYQENRRHFENPQQDSDGIAIVGNMNVGKTTLFTQICGKKTSPVNLPFNTVTITAGDIKGFKNKAFDTPGIFSIFSNNADERVSRDIFLPQISEHGIHRIILVADAKNMSRSLAIALQFIEYGLPMLLAINMNDEGISRGISLDTKKLSDILGIDVYTTVAREGMGINKVLSGIKEMRVAHDLIEYPTWVTQFQEIVAKLLPATSLTPKIMGLLLLAEDAGVEEYIKASFGATMLRQLKDLAKDFRKDERLPFDVYLTNLYNKKAKQIVDEVQKNSPVKKNPLIDRIGDYCTQLSTGIPIAIAVLYLTYMFIGSFGATYLADTINSILFGQYLIPWMEKVVAPIPSQLIRDMIMDPDFGVLPTGVFLALGLVTPVLFCFYFAIGLLEDSGYLTRLSILMDRVFQIMGLNGKGVIPIIMGFSCITMAVLTTRLLDTEKEKNIASFLLFLALPCAPLMAVMFVILDKMPISATLTVFGIIFSQILLAGFFVAKILPGKRTPLLMEIPTMRLPQVLPVLKTAALKTVFFMKEALPIFVIASLFVFFFQRVGGLALLERAAGPFMGSLVGLPEQSIQVFIKTMIRRESGAAELEHLSSVYTNLQLVVNMLVMTFIAPCINAIIILFKERGAAAASSIMITVVIYAFVLGSIVNHTCHLLNITFT